MVRTLNDDRVHTVSLFSGVYWLAGVAVTLAAATASVVLAVVFAATVALVAVVGGGLIAIWALVWKVRRPAQLRRAAYAEGAPVVLDARKVGHSWVAYGWDQAPR